MIKKEPKFLEMTSAEFRRRFITHEPEPKKNKYHAVKTEVNGVIYDSKKESRRGQYLEELQKFGKIKELEQKLAEKEREAVRKELTIKAQQLASQKGLPADLATYFIAENEELTIENIEKFDSAYKSHLDNAVIERTKGTTPKMTASQSPKPKDVKQMTFEEFARSRQENSN